MSDLWLNIRIFLWHIQAKSGRQWWKIYVIRNDYHIGNTKRFEVYDIRNPFGRV